MRRYVQTSLAGLAHLGRPAYDDDTGEFTPPATTLCGLTATKWSKSFVRVSTWSRKKPGVVCAACDRTAMWETISTNTAV